MEKSVSRAAGIAALILWQAFLVPGCESDQGERNASGGSSGRINGSESRAGGEPDNSASGAAGSDSGGTSGAPPGLDPGAAGDGWRTLSDAGTTGILLVSEGGAAGGEIANTAGSAGEGGTRTDPELEGPEGLAAEELNGHCVLRLPAIFRDFSGNDPDFGLGEGANECGIPEGDPIVPGIAQDRLDDEGRPVLGTAPVNACIQSSETFARWFRDGNGNVRVEGEVVLFADGRGTYANRFGVNGEKLVATLAPPLSQGKERQIPGVRSQESCLAGCDERERCTTVCLPEQAQVDHAEEVLEQLESEMDQLQSVEPPDEAAISELEAELVTARANLDSLIENASACDANCSTTFDVRIAACVADCKPCSYNREQWCTGGILTEFDGTPLFFPVDGVTGPTRDSYVARLPPQYGYNGWPAEGDIFPGAAEHNFHFTTEVQFWFRYEEGTDARLDLAGDDDLWVFVNGHLAVDLGGVHVPADGSVSINAASAAHFELKPGNLYQVSVFQAERKVYGSSFRIALSGFGAAQNDCEAR